MPVQFNDKFNSLPEALQQEVMQFIDYLLFKKQEAQKYSKKKVATKGKAKQIAETPEEKKIVTWGGMEVDITNVKRGFGCAKGMIELSPDWDEPLEDFKEYM